jgi:hypothetical protein
MQTRLSDIAESVEIIRLETRDDVLVGGNPTIAFADSLLLVYSSEIGLQIFDSRTGRYKRSLLGHKDRGPLGYSGLGASQSGLIVRDNKILLEKWNTFGLWDFTTGRLLDDDVPIGTLRNYLSLHFSTDSTLIVDRSRIRPEDIGKVELLSIADGHVIKGFGQKEKIDSADGMRSDRSYLYEHEGGYGYYSMVCDTIYQIAPSSYEFEPRFVLNLGSKLIPNISGGLFAFEGYISIDNPVESDRYLFLTYNDWLAKSGRHYVCFDKTERRTIYVDKISEGGYNGFEDDLSSLHLPFFPQNVTPDGRAYSVVQAVDIVTELGDERAAELGIAEDDNPVIVVAKLKK